VIAENVILLGGNATGNGSGGREESEQRPKPGKPLASRRAVTPTAEDVALEGDVPFLKRTFNRSAGKICADSHPPWPLGGLPLLEVHIGHDWPARAFYESNCHCCVCLEA
jgi:hypothetical protein